MVHVNTAEHSKLHLLRAWSGIGLAAGYLIFLSIICTSWVVALLTAHQFQHSVQVANLKDDPVALWQIIELHDSWKALQKDASISALALDSAQHSYSDLLANVQNARDNRNKAEAAMWSVETRLVGQ